MFTGNGSFMIQVNILMLCKSHRIEYGWITYRPQTLWGPESPNVIVSVFFVVICHLLQMFVIMHN